MRKYAVPFDQCQKLMKLDGVFFIFQQGEGFWGGDLVLPDNR
ncbi:hypothetical protein [Paenibacillus sp. sgz5001063]